jgi:translation initiation factor 4E
MFRDSLVPAWESFPCGGCWIIKVRKRNGVINRLWEELCFSCIGEWFCESEVVGIALSTRIRDDNISVWIRDSSNATTRLQIGEKLKEILNLDESTQLEYKTFKNAIVDGSTFRAATTFQFVPGQ